jgi:putative membrane protein insertion efficiency factor
MLGVRSDAAERDQVGSLLAISSGPRTDLREWLIAQRRSSRMVALIRVYQSVAPAQTRGLCRFTPTCSEYAVLAIEKYGVVRGSIRGLTRVLRCRPPNGGVDEP